MTCVHDWSLIPRRDWGGLRPSQKKNINCSYPIRFRCRKCRSVFSKRCGATKEEKCKPCAMSARRYRRIQMKDELSKRPQVIWWTLSGADAEILPWDKTLCVKKYAHPCNGPDGCKTEFIPTAIYNKKFIKCFNRFICAMQDLYPELDLIYHKTLETQKRGVLHSHGFIVGNFPDNFDFPIFFEVAAQIAERWGFGKEQDWELLDAIDHAVKISYCTKYTTKFDLLAWTIDTATGLIGKGKYHLHTKSRKWGRSMKEIKQFEYERVLASKFREAQLSILEAKLTLDSAVSLLAFVLGATPINAVEGGSNAPPLESTNKEIYGKI